MYYLQLMELFLTLKLQTFQPHTICLLSLSLWRYTIYSIQKANNKATILTVFRIMIVNSPLNVAVK